LPYAASGNAFLKQQWTTPCSEAVASAICKLLLCALHDSTVHVLPSFFPYNSTIAKRHALLLNCIWMFTWPLPNDSFRHGCNVQQNMVADARLLLCTLSTWCAGHACSILGQWWPWGRASV
jgi:hypothetical protein